MKVLFYLKKLTFKIFIILLLFKILLTSYFPSISRAESYDIIHNTQTDLDLSKVYFPVFAFNTLRIFAGFAAFA